MKFEFGSEVVCVDFHLHTRRDKEFAYTGDENRFVSNYIEALKAKGISIGVITNHNKFDAGEFKALSKKARQNDIFLLPGVELSIKEGKNGLHILVVFSPEDWLDNGNDLINGFITTAFQGVSNHENANSKCRFDLTNTLEELERHGKDYFVVFAHVEQSNGLLNECDGGLVQTLAKSEPFRKRVLGVQKLRSNANYQNLTQWLGYEIATVEGSDPKCLDEIGKEGCQSYIKVGNFTFDAVKYALLDHKSRQSSGYRKVSHGYIEKMHFIGGKFDGTEFNFSPELNTLIGIRGSGKSAILEVVRWLLDLEASADKQYKNKLIDFVLGSGGKVVMSIVDQHGKKYEVSKINNERINITDSEGIDLAVSINSLVKNPLYFGQKDLARTDTEANYEKMLLDKLLGDKVDSPESELDQIDNQISNALENLLNVTQIPEKISEIETVNIDLEHKLKIFDEKGITEKLEKQTEYDTDKTKLDGIIKDVKTVLSDFSDFLHVISQYEIDLSTYSSKYNSNIFLRVQLALDQIEANRNKLSVILNEIDASITTLNEVQTELSKQIDSLQDEFAKIQREVNEDTLDIKGFRKYTQQKAQNIENINRLMREASSEEEIKKTILGLARNRNGILKDAFDGYQSEITMLNQKQNALEICIIFKGNSENITSLISKSFKGTKIHGADTKTTQICEVLKDGISILLDILIDDGKELRKILREDEYLKIKEKMLSDYKSYVRCRSNDSISIHYHGKPLREHSLGQRASALVLSILAQDDSDIIIIDQPEDDLDNQVVYEEFIKTVKLKKSNVQFIFATHNPNIPVLGDAERIIAAAFTGSAIKLSIGNIDKVETHSLIIDIMEGGPDAFQKRNEIYTSWHKL